MSQENVQLVQRAMGAWAEVDRGDAGPERLAEFFASDTAWDMRPFSGWLERASRLGTPRPSHWQAYSKELIANWRACSSV